jgi:hypothetical protein
LNIYPKYLQIFPGINITLFIILNWQIEEGDYDLPAVGRDPQGEYLQAQITPILVSLVLSFCFLSLPQTAFGKF